MMKRMQSTFPRGAAGLTLLAFAAVAAVVLIAYWPVTGLGFYADDWIFYDLAGRLSFSDYLAKYFDPRVQTTWYRPVQGLLFRLEFMLFGRDPLGYHLLNVSQHLANCWLLFLLVRRVMDRRRPALIAALLFAALPTAALAVFWPGVVDTLETFLFLTAIWFWLSFLRTERHREYWLAFATFILALLTKEIAVSLPILFLLIERYWGPRPAPATPWVRRYAWFGLTWLAYAPIEYVVSQRSVFISREGYHIGFDSLWNLVNYSSLLAFPWDFVPWVSYALLGMATAFVLKVVLSQKNYGLIPLLAGAACAVLPIAPFPVVATRFLYLPLLASVTVYALVIEWLSRGGSRGWMYRVVVPAALVLVTINAVGHVSSGAVNFQHAQQASYLPFLDVSAAHPHLPDDSFFFFIDPPVPGPTLSGMFLWRYGPQVSVGANDSDQMPRLRDHQNARVVYFDEQGNPKELPVDKEDITHPSPALPARFDDLISLQAYQVTRTHLKAGDDLGLLLHWRALKPIGQDYTVSVDLVNAQGEILVAQQSMPREWREYANRRRAGEAIVDAHVLTMPQTIPSGIYRLEVRLSDAAFRPLLIMDATEEPVSDKLVIEPLVILE